LNVSGALVEREDEESREREVRVGSVVVD